MSFSSLFACIIFLSAILNGCSTQTTGQGAEKNSNLGHQTNLREGTSDPAGEPQDAESLCGKLKEIKKLPYRDPTDSDPVYDAIMLEGKKAVPCLIEKITDVSSMQDPREAPIWRYYVVGDTAAFILVDIAGDDDLLQQMLPPRYRDEWESNGIYAYFNYVSEEENRKELQKWWQDWLRDNS
ncbi:MAG TPA: hypothetical protein VMM38_06150 [Aridibacter sp.]|nr:hypothetical protein [Aridibacter sp.]